MRRVMFEGCAGWLHEAAGDTGVVLCAPQGHEMMWSHRAWRHLADDLGAAGLPVLRFDYPCTGDSSGGCGDGAQVDRAVSSIIAAAAQLRALTGVEKIVLCGLRLGAALAVRAADAMRALPTGGAAGLVLLAPVVSGRAYLRELKALHLGWLDNAGPAQRPEPPVDGAQDVLAFRIPADAVREIGAIRLDQQPACPAPRVWILDAWPGTVSPVSTLVQAYRNAGATVELTPFPEYAAVMQSSEYSAVPEQAWRQLVAWLSPLVRPLGSPRTADVPPQVASTIIDGVEERPVWFDGGRQFGILCTPPGREALPLAVLFPNTGGNHHVGDGCMFVTLSRRLARQGVAALRFDVSALGDSPAAARTMSIPAIYSVGPRNDVSAAVDWMRAQGFRRVMLAGVCSGAFLGLQTALANPGVDGLLMTNLVKFRWDSSDDATAKEGIRTWNSVIDAASKTSNWRRLWGGKARVWPVVVGVARHLSRRMRERGAAGMARLRGNGKPHESVTTYAIAAMQELNRRGVRTEFLYGSADVGLDEARFRLGRNLDALSGLEHIGVSLCDGIDHSLFLEHGREQFCDRLMRQVRAHLDEMAAPATHATPAAEADGLLADSSGDAEPLEPPQRPMVA